MKHVGQAPQASVAASRVQPNNLDQPTNVSHHRPAAVYHQAAALSDLHRCVPSKTGRRKVGTSPWQLRPRLIRRRLGRRYRCCITSTDEHGSVSFSERRQTSLSCERSGARGATPQGDTTTIENHMNHCPNQGKEQNRWNTSLGGKETLGNDEN